MKIELTNLKIATNLSEETTAYTGTVQIDGRPAFLASNEGRGGCDRFHQVSRYTGPSIPEIDAWLADNVAPSGPYEADPAKRQPWDTGHLCDLELLIARLMLLVEAGKILKQLLRKKIMVLGADGKLYEYKMAPTPEALASLHRRKPDQQIVNDGNEDIRARAIRLLANEPDYAEEVHARHRRGEVTKADAQWLLAQDARAGRPCPDLQAHLQAVITAADERLAAYRREREAALPA